MIMTKFTTAYTLLYNPSCILPLGLGKVHPWHIQIVIDSINEWSGISSGIEKGEWIVQ